jgi:hypothetical protein
MVSGLILVMTLPAITAAQAVEGPQGVTTNTHNAYIKRNKEPCKIDWNTNQMRCQGGSRSSTGSHKQSPPASQNPPWWRRWW